MPRVLTETLRQTPMSPGKVEFAWKTAVGPAMGRGANIRLEGTTLLVETPSREWSREVMRASPVILRRMNALLGDDAIKEIVVRA